MPQAIDKNQVIQSFNRAAHGYDSVAVLQRKVGEQLIQRLELVKLQPKIILDIGSGTGVFSRRLEECYPRAKIIALDIAYAMLDFAKQKKRWRSKQRFICADMLQLPFADQSVDMIFSNMAIHWCNDLSHMFKEFKRVLKPGGLFTFATLGPDTLQELRKSWQEVDDYQHVNQFIDMHDVGDMLMQAKFADPVMDIEYFTLAYPNVGSLVHELKTLGAHNMNSKRNKQLTGKQKFSAFVKAYEQFRDDEGRLPATYEVVYGHAWGTEPSLLSSADDKGEVNIPITKIGRRHHT